MNLQLPYILCLAATLFLGCNPSTQSEQSVKPIHNIESEKQRWTAEGWSFLETFGDISTDGLYLGHMSSSTAQSITAFASHNGTRSEKAYAQTNALFLVVSMEKPSGDTFALIFTKPK
jgi:hypothetical protein